MEKSNNYVFRKVVYQTYHLHKYRNKRDLRERRDVTGTQIIILKKIVARLELYC